MLKIYKTRDVKTPERAHSNDSGIDFFLPNNIEVRIAPWGNVKIDLWVKVSIPEGYDLTMVNKSWIASKTWLITWACLVDNGYDWELVLNLINTTKFEVALKPWQKIIQGVVRKVEYFGVEEVDELEFNAEISKKNNERWTGWFGSTWLI